MDRKMILPTWALIVLASMNAIVSATVSNRPQNMDQASLEAGIRENTFVSVGQRVSERHSESETVDKIHRDLHKPRQHTTNVRLPRHLVPTSYALRLLPFIEDDNFTFTGTVVIELRAVDAGSNITLHAKNIVIDESSIQVNDHTAGVTINVEACSYDRAKDFFIIHTQTMLTRTHLYTVTMTFSGIINQHLAGFYRSSYKDSTGSTKWLAVTQFEATDARQAFPCLDEPALKAVFNITIGRRANMTALSNMPKLASRPSNHLLDYTWDVFDSTLPMSTYLLAFVVSDFDFKLAPRQINEPEFRVWAQPEAIDQADYALQVGPAVLSHFERFFKTKYPLPKQDMVAIPDFSAGAMENWGLITFKETAMLWDSRTSSIFDKQRVAIVVAHELAHQWFGNLVTPYWWTDLWLNEGFATYMEYQGVDYVEPSWRISDQFSKDTRSAMETDCLLSSHPVSIPVSSPQEIGEIFDDISYKKGAALIKMMEGYLSMDTLRQGLAKYLHKFQFKATDQSHLWNALTVQAHEDGNLPNHMTIKTIMDTWTLQMGYPMVIVQRNYSDESATVRQTRFSLSETTHSDDLWWIPLSIVNNKTQTQNSSRNITWMSTKNTLLNGIESTNSWILLGTRQTGYYRVNYDHHNWRLITEQLLNKHTVISTIDRAQIVDDVFHLARSGHLPYKITFDILSYLEEENEYLPWDAAFDNFKYIENQLRTTDDYPIFKQFILRLIHRQYNRLGFSQRPEDTLNDHLHRSNILAWACRMGHSACVEHSVHLFAQWMQQPRKSQVIPVNIRDIVYCTAMREGGQAEWQFAAEQYRNAESSSEQLKLIVALGCTQDQRLIERYLNSLLGTSSWVRTHDGVTVLSSVTSSAIGMDTLWRFLRDNWLHISKKYGAGSFGMPKIVDALKNGFNTAEKLQQLKNFMRAHSDQLVRARRGTKQALETARNDINWMIRYRHTVIHFMQLDYNHTM